MVICNFVIGFFGIWFDYQSMVLLVAYEIVLDEHGWIRKIVN
jgi:hypothetical protein